MKKQAVQHLSSVIRANTERRTLEELAAAGKRHVRVVSGEKVMQLIEAIVDDAIQREAVTLAQKDRDRLVEQTREEFDRVLKIQADQEALTAQHKELAERAEQRAEKLAAELAEELARRSELEENVSRLHQENRDLSAEIAEAKRRAQGLEEECAAAQDLAEEAVERGLAAQEELEGYQARLAQARETIEGFEGQYGKLESELVAEREREAELRATLKQLERQVEKSEQMAAAFREESEAAQWAEVRGELTELKSLVHSMAERPAAADPSLIEAIASRLAEQETGRTVKLEARFNLQMERTLDEVTRALRLATAKPIDFAVEATDVLVARVFDHEAEMQTNLGDLAVEQRSTTRKISDSLARLRQAQNGISADDDAADSADD